MLRKLLLGLVVCGFGSGSFGEEPQERDLREIEKKLLELKDQLDKLESQKDALEEEKRNLEIQSETLKSQLRDEIRVELTGTLGWNEEHHSHYLTVRHFINPAVEQRVWLWVFDEPRMTYELKQLIGKRVAVKGALYQRAKNHLKVRLPDGSVYVAPHSVELHTKPSPAKDEQRKDE